MGFCKYCGIELDSDSLFCPSCGKKVKENTEDDTNNKSPVEKNEVDLVNGLKKCIELLSPYQGMYDQRDQLLIDITNYSDWPKTTLTFYGGFIFFSLLILFILANITYYADWNSGLALLFFSIFGLLLPWWLSRKYKSHYDYATGNIDSVTNELIKHFNSQELPISIAFEYSNPRIMRQLLKYIETGRADTLKEAINCLISDNNQEALMNKKIEVRNNSDLAAIFAMAAYLNTRK